MLRMLKIRKTGCFILFLSVFLNLLCSHGVFSHGTSKNYFILPIKTKMVKNEEEYKTTFFYYPVGNTGIYDFSIQVEHISSGAYYREALEMRIIDQQGMECVLSRPFLFDGHIHKVRYELNNGGQYRLIIQFGAGDKQRTVEFPFEVQEKRIEDLCPWCGMLVTDSKTAYFLRLNTGEEKKACCIHCAISFRNKFRDELISLETLDYFTAERVNAQKVWFVKNSTITLENSMPPYILAFASEKSARDFQEIHMGETVMYAGLEKEILAEEDTNHISSENAELSLLKEMISVIRENYYREMQESELLKLSAEEVMASLDKDSTLKKIQPSSLDFIRGFERDETISDARVIRDAIGYVKIAYFGRRTKEDFVKALKRMKESNLRGLIIDLRNNPGGNLKEATHIMQYFIPNGKLLASFQSKDRHERYFSQTDEKWSYPLVVLINNTTASSAEIFAATLRYYEKATLVGKKSYGKGTIQKTFPLNHDHSLILTIGKSYAADGATVKDSGIQPDYVVEGEIEQIKFAIKLLEQR
ncbi:MAG: hypothetical protein AYP45_13910 [Candidatus Brocadia carolinensis]|uniref:Tail specific protease domain-containing protein n=1 Tax=Candidatus Brocadia carolinensis TaxID=1004156 RepID=A0A1V4AR81_9BACT|nr:MAG: hypothetical protein AYP45_13910 [Candidatus Brocadia caroliniensis]